MWASARMFFGIRFEGIEHIPQEGPLLITPNHVTFADPPLVSIPIAIVALGEKIGWRESLGIVCALAAVVMLSTQSEPQVVPAATLEGESRI